MLDPRAPWYGRYVVYCEGRTPFSKQEQREPQRAVPLLTGTLHRSCPLCQANTRGALFEALVRMRGTEVALLDAQGRELWRTPGVEALLYSHFSSTDAWEGGLPAELAGLLARLLREKPPRISAKASLGSLTVTFVQLLLSCSWAIILEDVLPAPWRGILSRREAAVAAGVLQGWDTKLISSELGCSAETVKKHLQAIYRKLAVPGRAKLIALAHDYTAF